jgi:hypothetical protein
MPKPTNSKNGTPVLPKPPAKKPTKSPKSGTPLVKPWVKKKDFGL